MYDFSCSWQRSSALKKHWIWPQELLSISPFEAPSSFVSDELLWDYSDALTKVVPALIDCAAMRALHLLCDLLDRSLALACGNSQQTEGRDRSDNWREQIEVNLKGDSMSYRIPL